MTLEDVAFSRPLAASESLGELASDCHRFLDKHVLLTAESDVVSMPNGRECTLSALRLLVRICPNVSVVIPQANPSLLSECKEIAAHIAFGKPVEFPLSTDWAGYDAILCIGKTARPDLPYTVINSNGWIARVSSGQTGLPEDCSQFNPIASLAAASLGTAEVFKRMIGLKPIRGKLLGTMDFNLSNYQVGDPSLGPALPTGLSIDLLIAGAGAIGNGVVYLLSRLPVRGRVMIVDRQAFGRENLGTSLLIGPEHVGKDKAIVAASFFGAYIEARGYREELGTFTQRLGTELSYPKIVLGCLDNIETRHELQRIWADMTIDGAIGDFTCQISSHLWGQDGACLICLFRQPDGQLAEDIASRSTGLSRERCQLQLEVVTEGDVLLAVEGRKDWLRNHLGQQICSVIREGTAQAVSNEQQRRGFQPSVPFVATLSASMAVAELVKHITGWKSQLDTRFQLDVLQGPARGQMMPEDARKDCECVTRSRNIDLVRAKRTILADCR